MTANIGSPLSETAYDRHWEISSFGKEKLEMRSSFHGFWGPMTKELRQALTQCGDTKSKRTTKCIIKLGVFLFSFIMRKYHEIAAKSIILNLVSIRERGCVQKEPNNNHCLLAAFY